MAEYCRVFIHGVKKSDACFGNFLAFRKPDTPEKIYDRLPKKFVTTGPWNFGNMRAHCLHCGYAVAEKTPLFYSTFSMPQSVGTQFNVKGIFCDCTCTATFVVREIPRSYWGVLLDNLRMVRKALFATPVSDPLYLYEHRRHLKRYGGAVGRREYLKKKTELDVSKMYAVTL